MNPTFKSHILLPLAIVVLNTIVDHYAAPLGLFATAWVLPVIAGIIVFLPDSPNLWKQSFLCFLFAALNDLGIKLYGGGVHDEEGHGWIHALLFVGLVPVYIILIVSTVKNKTAPLTQKIGSLLLFPVLVAIYLYFFSEAGFGRYY